MPRLATAAAVLAAGALPAAAHAVPTYSYGFSCFNPTTGTTASACASQAAPALTLSVTEAATAGAVSFALAASDTFANVVTALYFNQGFASLFDLAKLDLAAGSRSLDETQSSTAKKVDFEIDARRGSLKPANMPGANNLGRAWTTSFSVSAASPSPTWGLNAGERLGLTLALAAGRSFSEVTAALADQTLALGLHVQNLDNQSATLANLGAAVVTGLASGTGAGGGTDANTGTGTGNNAGSGTGTSTGTNVGTDTGTGASGTGLPGGQVVTPVTPVPEPAEWAMMAAGLALVGGVARRRTARGTAAAAA